MLFEDLTVLDAARYRFCLLTDNPKNFGEAVISAGYEEHVKYDEYHLILVDYDSNYIPKIVEALEPEKKNRYNNKVLLYKDSIDPIVDSIAKSTFKYDTIEERNRFIRVVEELAVLPGLICMDLYDIEACLMSHKRLKMKSIKLNLKEEIIIDIKLHEDAVLGFEANNHLSLRTIEKVVNAIRVNSKDTNLVYGTTMNEDLTDDEVIVHIIYSMEE